MRREMMSDVFRALLMVALIAAVGCVVCAPAAQAADKVYELSLATQHPAEAPMNKVVNVAWANYLEKASNGRLKIVPFPGEQAAKSSDLYDACRTGLVDIACQMHAFTGGRFPLTEVTSLPFIFDFPGSRAAALTTMALYKKYPEIQNEYKGVIVMGFHANGLNHIHTIKKPVKKLEDLKGLVLQSYGKFGTQTTKALGGTPESLLPSEVYDAMAKNVLDGDCLEWEGQFIWHYNELTHYSAQVGMSLFTFVHVMNKKSFEKLPKDLQDIIMGEESLKWFELHGYNFDRDDVAFRDTLDAQYKKEGGEGVYVLPDEERERWKKAATPVVEGWVKEAAKKVGEEKARAILADAIAFAKEYSGYPDEACPTCAETLKAWDAPGY